MGLSNSGLRGIPSGNYSEIFSTTPTAQCCGSVDTMVRYFSVNTVVGSAISVVSNTINGNIYTINEDGVYAISYDDTDGTGGSVFGISKNSPYLTTSILDATNDPFRVGIAFVPTASWNEMLAPTLLCRAGDKIRCHAQTAQHPDSQSITCTFRITKVA